MLFSSRLTLISDRKGTNKNEHSPFYTTLRTKLSPSKIPTNVSFTSSATVIKALRAEDKRWIPFVERAALKTKLASIKEIRVSKSCYLHWTISSIKKIKSLVYSLWGSYKLSRVIT